MIKADDDPRWQLRPIQNSALDESYGVATDGFTIGRGADCTLRVSDARYPQVSGVADFTLARPQGIEQVIGGPFHTLIGVMTPVGR